MSQAGYGPGQDTHFTYRRQFESLRKVDITCCTVEAAYWLWLGCWSNKRCEIHPSLVHSTVEYSSVWCCSAHSHWPCHQRRLANCDWIPASYTRGNLSIVAGIQHSELRRKGATLSLACLSHGAWTSASLSAHLYIERKCTASQIDSCTRCTTTHQFFWRQ